MESELTTSCDRARYAECMPNTMRSIALENQSIHNTYDIHIENLFI